MSSQLTHTATRAARIVRGIVHEARVNNVPFMAGSIAYSAFISLLPLVLLLVIAASVIGGEPLASYTQGVTESYLTPAGQSLLADSISQAGSQTGLSILGVGVLLWGVLRVFRALDTAFSAIYGTQRKSDLTTQFKNGVVVLVTLGIALLAVLAVGLTLRFVPDPPFSEVVGEVSLIFGLSVVFVPIYYVFPDADVSVKMILPGAVVAAVGWTLLNAGFGVYVTYSSTQDLYGVIGGVVLLITFLYFGALVILIGAVTNAVLMGTRPPISVEKSSPQ
ncbi:ribonuclease BN [Halorubrum aidingense JCM 13560]|uniref:Ribonuclease BN n=1 Tax=Halorubrum aidingense JCM 13560 TaxID=1230454 RepID=M0PKY4_9EURY|nr:YihY/virulence factor BrkB family protein [Halorubrum aidingense]EMA70736.1 ribonuclease BN [Halorubrum aidingense JCM 13560]